MGRTEKVDFRANGEVDFKGLSYLHPKFSKMPIFLIPPRLASAKRNGVPYSLFWQNNFKEVPHAAGNDYQDTPSF